MKENLKTILASLRNEQARLETEKQSLYEQSRALSHSRQAAARRCVQTLLPDLNQSTIKTLEREAPGFHIPMVSTWLGLFKKIDPNVTVDTLRMQLGAYLDDYLTGSKTVPDIWISSVARADGAIRDLQENVRENESILSEVRARIEAIEKLSSTNLRKMNPKTRRKLERALAAQAKSTRPFVRQGQPVRGNRVAPTYPTQSQDDSDSGPSLFEMWLWYQLLTPGSETSHAFESFSGGGGTSAGAGAGGGWQEKDSDLAPAATAPNSIDTHIALGAGSFS